MMPKIKKRKKILSVRRKYHYRVDKETELQESDEPYVKLEVVTDDYSEDYYSACFQSSVQTYSLPIDTISAQRELNVASKCVQTQDVPDEDRHYCYSEDYYSACFQSPVQTYSLPIDTISAQRELNVASKGVQTQDVPDEDHLYALREEEGNEIETSEPDTVPYTSFENNTMDEKDVYMEGEEVVVQTQSFCKFKAELEHEFCIKNFHLNASKDNVKLLDLYNHTDAPSVKLSVTINSDFSCDLFVHRKKVERTHDIWEGLPTVFDNVFSVHELCERISQYKVCPGNKEEEFWQLVPVGSEMTSNTSTEVLAYREGDFQAKHCSGIEYSSTIRSVNCHLLTLRKFKCAQCSEYGYLLKRRMARLKERLNSDRVYNHTGFKHKDMTRNELIKKLTEQKEEIKNLQQELWKLKRVFEKEINKNRWRVCSNENLEMSSSGDKEA